MNYNAEAVSTTAADTNNLTTVSNVNASAIPNTIPISSPSTTAATDGKSLDVRVELSPYPAKTGDIKFKISFLQPNNITQVHVDYDVAITKMNQEVFRASSVTAQPLLHTAEGVVTIPYKFDHPGKYLLIISVMGINFIPIKPEVANFDLDVN